MEVEIEREEDGRSIAEVRGLPGVMAYGSSRSEALAAVRALALEVLADRAEPGRSFAEPLFVVPSARSRQTTKRSGPSFSLARRPYLPAVSPPVPEARSITAVALST